MFRYWRDLLNAGEARILTAVWQARGHSLSKSDVGIAAGISHTSGTFGTYMSKLRTLELVLKDGNGDFTINPELA